MSEQNNNNNNTNLPNSGYFAKPLQEKKSFKPSTPADPEKLFKKFNEIEPVYRTVAIEEIRAKVTPKDEFVVLEKVHGANFSIITDGTKVLCAKRTSLLYEEEESQFFFFKTFVKDKYAPGILKGWAYLKEKNPEMKILRVFGEIFGGVYPHKEVKAVPKAKHVQTGIYYCPQVEFYAFDANVDGTYLDYDAAVRLFHIMGMSIYAEPLFRGSFEEALKYPKRFITTLPKKYFNLPEIKDNWAEGIYFAPSLPNPKKFI